MTASESIHPSRARRRATFLLLGALLLPAPISALAQEEMGEAEVIVLEDEPDGAGRPMDGARFDRCPSPSLGSKAIVGAGAIFFTLICVILFSRLGEQLALGRDWRNPRLGRELGISFALLLGVGSVAVLAYVTSGCWPSESTVWVGFGAGVWALHGIVVGIVAGRS